ncbi:MAG: RiPP maturation radical SAM C-methyltransferase [Deltaproteobacteria bacterium]
MRVALVCMPFADVQRPAVGVSLLKAELADHGVECDVVYPSIWFARQIGLPEYRFIAEELWRALAAEWVFARSLYGAEDGRDEGYVDDVLVRLCRRSIGDVARVMDVREKADGFISWLAGELRWDQYDVIGFTSYAGQNLASLSLARRIKDKHPSVVVVFGGRNWEAEMGRELHRQFPFVDFVCSGEADISFPALLEALRDGGRSIGNIGGLVYRRGGRTRSTGGPEVVRHLDSLPHPDFIDYFDALTATGYANQFLPALPMEYSRGCWWAARRPCAFCGLNGTRVTYRSKSPGRFFSEARSLLRSWRGSCLELVDMVVPPRFFSDVVPELATDPLPVKLLVQVRATLSRADLTLARQAGVEVQCGIESISGPVLAAANKGTTMLENLLFLKWCRAAGVEPMWPMLYGFPEERSEHYREVSELIPSIAFLTPPSELGAVLVARFSAYFTDPARFGLRRLRPLVPYRHIYRVSGMALRRIALFFTADGCDQDVTPSYLGDLSAAVGDWQRDYRRGAGSLWGESVQKALVLHDERRPGPPTSIRLDECDAALYRACDAIAVREELEGLVWRDFPDEIGDLSARLQRLVDLRLILPEGDRYLSLAVLE